MPHSFEKARERQRRYRQKRRDAKCGPNAPDQRGQHGRHPSGPKSPLWNADRKMISQQGYVKIRLGRDHPLADPNGYAYEHLVVWVSAGRERPGPGWVIHHKNEDKTDNRLDNFELKRRHRHGVDHQPRSLPDAQVIAMRNDFAGGDHTGLLAKRYGVPIQRAWKIVRGLSRREVGGPICEAPLRNARAGRLLDGVTHDGFPEART